jgi:hypothetical protein
LPELSLSLKPSFLEQYTVDLVLFHPSMLNINSAII